MADVADMADDLVAERLAAGIAKARSPLAIGEPGECNACGFYNLRLVDGMCGFCRDGRQPPADWEPPIPPAGTVVLLADGEESKVASKTIQLPAYADDAAVTVDRYATEHDCTKGEAARILIELGAETDAGRAAGPVDLSAISLEALLEELKKRAVQENLEFRARAETAERKLAAISEAMAA